MDPSLYLLDSAPVVLQRPPKLLCFMGAFVSYAAYLEIVATYGYLAHAYHMGYSEYANTTAILFQVFQMLTRLTNPLLFFLGSPYRAVLGSFVMAAASHAILGLGFFTTGWSGFVWVLRIATALGGIAIGTFAPNWWKLLDLPSQHQVHVEAAAGKEVNVLPPPVEEPPLWARVLLGASNDATKRYNAEKSAGLLGIPLGVAFILIVVTSLYVAVDGPVVYAFSHWVVGAMQLVVAGFIYKYSACFENVAAVRVSALDVIRAAMNKDNLLFIVLGLVLLAVQIALEFGGQIQEFILGESKQVHAACDVGVTVDYNGAKAMYGVGNLIGNLIGTAIANNYVAHNPDVKSRSIVLLLGGSVVGSWASMILFLYLRGWTSFIWGMIVLLGNGIVYSGLMHLAEANADADLLKRLSAKQIILTFGDFGSLLGTVAVGQALAHMKSFKCGS